MKYLLIVLALCGISGEAFSYQNINCHSEYIDGCQFVVCPGSAWTPDNIIHHPTCTNTKHALGPVPSVQIDRDFQITNTNPGGEV